MVVINGCEGHLSQYYRVSLPKNVCIYENMNKRRIYLL